MNIFSGLDIKSIDDPPALQSPLDIDEQSQQENPSPPPMNDYNNTPALSNLKILTKGSKKWISDEPMQLAKPNIYTDHRLNKDDINTSSLEAQEQNIYDRTKISNLTDYGRNTEASNASLLVEAALDSVCSEPNIDIDVGTAASCTDSLVNNLYTLAPHDNLPDVSYNSNMCINESRDINLISPSVNDHISVTDELGDELRHNQTIGIDYSNFQQEEFSPVNSPEAHHRSNFVRNYINTLSPHNYTHQKNLSPVPSPPRYDFGHGVQNEHLSSDDSNGLAAQNLSLHNTKNVNQLDLSVYKSPYKLDTQDYMRKDFRLKFDSEISRKIHQQSDGGSKMYNDGENPLDQEQIDNLNQHVISAMNVEDKSTDNHDRAKYPDDLSTDIRNKFELDLDMRLKSYENVESDILRRGGSYEPTTAEIDFRNKNYDLVDSIDSRNKSYENIENEFRTERNFEPLVLNSTELQGLDMSARSFHNYTNINRYHHLYPDVDRVDLRLNYSPPPPTYTHADILRVVSLDLTPPGRHSVDLSLRNHPLHTIANRGLLGDHGIQPNPHRLLDQSRLLTSDLSSSRLLTDSGPRILSDHTTNRILSTNDQLTTNHLITSDTSRLLSEDTRILSEPPRLLEQSRLLGDSRILQPSTPNGTVSPVPGFSGYSVAQGPYHPTPIAPRPHVNSPTPSPYHPYSSYY